MTCEDRDLKYLQSLPLEEKIQKSKERVIEWYIYFGGKVYVCFSGGKDSTVLLDIVRSIYPNVAVVFVNTTLEFLEIRDFVKTFDNVTWVKSKMSFLQVVKKYGWPILSKQVAMGFDRYRNTRSDIQKDLRLNGGINPTSGKKQCRTIPKKWQYLLDAPFKISDRCCSIMKKQPLKKYEKESGNVPIIGTMAQESQLREIEYIKHGCNAFDKKAPISAPLSFWNDDDIWAYIKLKNLPYSKIYDMGYKRTGCMYCLFGHHLEEDSRVDLLKKTHPKEYKHCMDKIGMREVLEWYPKKIDKDQTKMF